ncbi:unnamed protein product [Sphagnum jensenii]|uniref:Uncharacterized protein n=1 Tax=Sphagnum jensenii TaxID=128206 RepID=A0ABP1A2S4_9BRYO
MGGIGAGKKAVGVSSACPRFSSLESCVHIPSFSTCCSQRKELVIFCYKLEKERQREKCSAAMAVAYASAYSAVGKQSRRPAPRRGQVKAAIAASLFHALTSIVHGARSAALSHSHSRWSFRSS